MLLGVKLAAAVGEAEAVAGRRKVAVGLVVSLKLSGIPSTRVLPSSFSNKWRVKLVILCSINSLILSVMTSIQTSNQFRLRLVVLSHPIIPFLTVTTLCLTLMFQALRKVIHVSISRVVVSNLALSSWIQTTTRAWVSRRIRLSCHLLNLS